MSRLFMASHQPQTCEMQYRAHYRLSNVGIECGVISWEVRGYLSETQRKNCSPSARLADSPESSQTNDSPLGYLIRVDQY